MNKYLLYFFLVSVFLLNGCLKGEEDLFPDSPAIRLNKTISGVDSALVQVPNGWIMEYFATSESPGYAMLINFGINGEATVAAKNNLVKNKYVEAKSSFDVIGDNGPVLTFNTYNDVLHLFSDPIDPDGAGLEGDYEFIVLDYSDTLIHLKGKKRGTEISLKSIPVDISWADYFLALDHMHDELFGSGPLDFISGTDTIVAYNGVSHIFEMDGIDTTGISYIPFIVTIDGLKFYSPFETKTNKEVQSFYLNDDGSRLIAREDSDTFFKGTENSRYVVESLDKFVFDFDRSSNHYKDRFVVLSQQMHEKYKGKRDIDVIALSYTSVLGHSFFFSTTPTITNANFKIEMQVDPLNKDLVIINKVDGEYDSNGELFLSSVPSIADFWEELNGTYQLNSKLSKNEIKFVDNEDSSRFFVVTKK